MGDETIYRLGFFIGAFALIALFEILTPRRVLTTSKSKRWFSNLTIIAIIVSMALKLAAVAALGPSALAVLIFEITLNATAMFNHSK